MDKKYGFTEETMTVGNHVLRQIVALKNFDVPSRDGEKWTRHVMRGDLGGFIEKEENLSQEGGCWVFSCGYVFGEAKIIDNANIFGAVYGNARIEGVACVGRECVVCDHAIVSDSCDLDGGCTVYENAHLSGNCRVSDCYTFIRGFAHVTDDAIIEGFAKVEGKARVSGESHITNRAEIAGCAHVDSCYVSETMVDGQTNLVDSNISGRFRICGRSEFHKCRVSGSFGFEYDVPITLSYVCINIDNRSTIRLLT